MINRNWKDKLLREINRLDPENKIVKIDLKHSKICYNRDLILLHERIEKLTDEEVVRAFLVCKLVKKMGYDKKHTIELERRYPIGRPPKEGAKIDIIVTKDGKPFMLFEVKSPKKYEQEMEGAIKEQLFKVAPGQDPKGTSLRYLVYYTAYVSDEGELIEKRVTIDYRKFKTWEEWDEAGRPNLMSIPKDYGVVKKPVFIKNGDHDLRKDVTKDELERIRWNIHNILWAGGKYHVELFFNLMGILLAKIYDEKETEDGKPYQFQIFYKNDEESHDEESPDEVYERINKLYRKALKEYLGLSDEELKKVKDIVFDPPKVKYVVEVLQEISLTTNKYDILGEFFEKIVRTEFKQSKGQYLTHVNIVRFILRALEVEKLALKLINEEKRLPYILDPACGSGTFLIEAMKLITSYILANQDKLKKSKSVKEFVEMMFPKSRRNAWANWYIYGIEINTDLATATKVNMVGHGDGSANIEAKDGLLDFEEYTKDLLQVKKSSDVYSKPINEQFDIVVSNPPFSITIDKDTAKNLSKVFIWGEKIKQQLDKAKKKKEVSIENLFIERWYQLLKPKGRLGVVLPESVFDTTANRYVRLFIYKYFWIKAIVSLPDLAFQPYTPTKTSLLFAQKKTPEEIKEWNELWNKYKEEYIKSRKRIDELFKTKYKTFDYEERRKELVERLKELLGENFDDRDITLDIKELKEKYAEEIKLADEEWWIFRKISEKLNYKIFMAHAEEIGYKRGIRGEEKRPNDLFRTIGDIMEELFGKNWENLDNAEFEKKRDEIIEYLKKTETVLLDELEKRPLKNIILEFRDHIVIDTENPRTILDYLRRVVEWE